ncbi:hypothetical protein Tco_1081960 [Tanacetum coccineum]|uniref:Transposase (Putative), gypsy type n=1 Tax=Tanacetum coccineum TaxID=301880 RepID=A0ABQ5HZ41_9ASTR
MVPLRVNLGVLKEVAAMRPPMNKRGCQRGTDEAEANAPPKVLRKDHATPHPAQSTHGGKSLAVMGLKAGSTLIPVAQETFAGAKSVSDPDPLSSSKGTATDILPQYVATTEVNVQLSVGSPNSGKSTSVPSVDGSPGGIYQPGWGVTNNCLLDTPEACQDMVDYTVPPRYFFELCHLPNTKFLGQYNMNLAWQVAMGSQLMLRFEQEVKTVETEVHGLRNRAQNLETLLEAEVDMKKVAEAKNANLDKELESLRAQFSDLQYEDDKVEQRCAEMDARLDALSIDFDEELYPHMLTAIVGRRWVIGHGLRLAVMKCAESTELRQVFADVVFAGIVKGMSEGLKHRVEHGEAKLDLAAIKAYDLEADAKYVAAFQALKDLKFPLVDQLKKLKDAPIDLIIASLHLEDPWSIKEEILLEDAIVANISRAEKKKKYQVLPSCWRMLLHRQISEDEASLRLLRSKSLPPMYNLDWP